MQCGPYTRIKKCSLYGVNINVRLKCSNGHMTWSSYEKNKNFSANTQMAAAILMSDSTFSQFKDALNIMDDNLVSKRTFYRLQSTVLYPAINAVYNISVIKY